MRDAFVKPANTVASAGNPSAARAGAAAAGAGAPPLNMKQPGTQASCSVNAAASSGGVAMASLTK